MTLLAINWPAVGLQAGYLIFSLSILVIIHEFGHFITAKWFKCRVEKFYLFFDPWFSIFKKKVGETEYGIGWLPLGGYVKISGMVDESMDKEQIKQPPQPWEFRSKPAWQRLIILLAGVTMNVLLAFVIYAMILFTWGETKLPNQNAKNGIWVTDSLMSKIGLQNGDKIEAINGEPVKYFDDIPIKILLGRHITVDRDGKEKVLDVPINMIEQLVEKKGKRNGFVEPRLPVIVGGFEDSISNARNAGLKAYDQIIAVDSTPVAFFDQMRTLLAQKKGDSVTLTVKRNNETLQTKALIDTAGQIGFYVINGAQ